MAVEVNPRKVAIIGAGFVGSATAFALSQSSMFSEMVLIDADHEATALHLLSQLRFTQETMTI